MNALDNCQSDLLKSRAEVARLREALAFYGEEANHNRYGAELDGTVMGDVERDYGLKARTALSKYRTTDDWLAGKLAEEREQCAVKCDKIALGYANIPDVGETGMRAGVATICKNVARECAAAIREANDE